MLCYKAWRESAVRVGVGALTLAWFCLIFAVWQPARTPGTRSYAAYMTHAVYDGIVPNIFVVVSIVLGLGGLLHERAHGTAGFTLAIPVSRPRLVGARAAVGLVEVFGLAMVPALVIASASPLVHQAYPLAHALRFAVLWSGCGIVVFAAAFLVSVVVPGEYSAPAVCTATLLFYLTLVSVPPLARFPAANVFSLMNVAGPIPWMQLAALALVALAAIAAGAVITGRQDF